MGVTATVSAIPQDYMNFFLPSFANCGDAMPSTENTPRFYLLIYCHYIETKS